MSNDEINRKVAEIEGWHFIKEKRMPERLWKWERTNPYDRRVGPPPYATDWQWCGPLVEKYRLCVDAACSDEVVIAFTRGVADCVKDKTPQRAICLAVISAQEGE